MSDRHTVPTAQMPQPSTPQPVRTVLPEAPAASAKNPGADFYRYLPRVLMFTNAFLAVLVVLSALLLTHRTTYEYMTVSPSDVVFNEEMNEYGAKGWKTESCRRATSSSGYSASYECIMSRSRLGW